MAYKFDILRGCMRPTTSNSAYGLQSLRPPIPANEASKVFPKLEWAQDPAFSNAEALKTKKLLEHRAVLQKSADIGVHLRTARDIKLTYRPSMLLVTAGLGLALYSAFKLGFLKG